MMIYYRKKYPYYGRYKCKAELNYCYNYTNNAGIKPTSFDLIKRLNQLLSQENYKLYGHYCIYIKEEKHLDILLNDIKFKDILLYVYKPAPGYEHLTGKEPDEKKTLWYKRFSYKIMIRNESSRNKSSVDNLNKIITWCDENLQNAYQRCGIYNKVTFFFSNKHDAAAFKLAFSDKIEKQEILDKNIVVKELKKRIKQAREDLKIYLKGEE